MRSTLLFLALAASLCADAPQATLGNGKLKAVFYLPDAANGYYRGARFDWSGVIKSLTYNGHEYFGVWFDKYDPELHDAITGPVEEFVSGDTAPGWNEAKAGGKYVRIGIGTLQKPDDKAFQRFGRYKVVDPGVWKVSQNKNRIVFEQMLADSGTGYSYRYKKTIRLAKGEPALTIEHKLTNTGKKAISTDTYNHNFFMIDGEPSGPNMEIKFPFAAASDRDMTAMAAHVADSRLNYKRELPKGESVFTELKGFSNSSKDYDFRIENKKSRAGVRIRGDRPLSKLVFWSIKTVLSPEPYIHMDIQPGKSSKWAILYDFYTF